MSEPDPHLRRHPYIQTYTGLRFSYDEPGPFRLRDIAHSLAMTPRFRGHCTEFLSVAEHCVLVSYAMQDEGLGVDLQIAGLLHDAHEAYFGDVPSPMKWNCPEVRTLEDRIQRAMREALTPTIPDDVYDLVKPFDLRALHAEAWAVLDPIPDWALAPGSDEPGHPYIRRWEWKIAEYVFVQRARDLGLPID